MTLKCLSDGVPTPTLSWYKPEGSEINRVRARENKVQVPLRGDQDFGHYKCIAANGLIPSDEKLIKINQVSMLMRSVHFSFAFAHSHSFWCIRRKSQISLQSIRQSNSFILCISFDSLTCNTMLFPGEGSVRMVKNCDRGLENAARASFQKNPNDLVL